ncbi:hypothetical protein LCGC14_0594820 [marine sediment metagenome]|uniref:Aminoglycoside phosphotransferase domain-containing protein n=1 Tax=marine sediment metagenome TaxID=412755 RepID=A0A0F9RH98_9ZZZZ
MAQLSKILKWYEETKDKGEAIRLISKKSRITQGGLIKILLKNGYKIPKDFEIIEEWEEGYEEPNLEEEMFTSIAIQKFLGYRISDKRNELFNTVFSKYPPIANERITKENITIIHGDAHLWNFLCPKDINNEKLKACLIDWATWGIGVGCQDLSNMIGMFFYPDYRQLVEKNLIKRYHDTLLKFGIKNYSWDDCWYDYKLFTLSNLHRIAVWWSIGLPLTDLWRWLESSFCTIEDLNCLELLESK